MRLNYYLFFLCFILSFLFACSKETINKRRIKDSWKCDMVRIEDGSGFFYYDTLNNNNDIEFTNDSVFATINFEFIPLGETFNLKDSLILKNTYSIDRDELGIENQELVFRIKHLSNSQFVMAYYDSQNYRTKTFYFTKH